MQGHEDKRTNRTTEIKTNEQIGRQTDKDRQMNKQMRREQINGQRVR